MAPSPLACARTLALGAGLAAGILLMLCPRAATADSSLLTLGEGEVKELAHQRDITLSAELAEIVDTITLGNLSKGDAEALYHFDLPAQAAITELVVRDANGHATVQGFVDSIAATRLLDDSRYVPDMGLLRMIASEGDGEDQRKRYELRVFPVPAQKSSVITLRWHTPVRLVSGTYSLRLPAAGESPTLARTSVQLTSALAMGQLYGGDKLLAARSARGQRFSVFAPVHADLVIQGQATDLGTQARAELAIVPLGAKSGVLALRVVVPDSGLHAPPAIERVVLVIDVSRSLEESGRDAAALLVDGLLSELGTSTAVEAILFDRKAQRVLGSFQPAERDTRAQIVRAIKSAQGNNGSDLVTALSLARTALREQGQGRSERSLVAIISDGMLPISVRPDEAVDALGTSADLPRVLSAVLVPDNAPIPDLQDSALSALAFRSQGRVVALRAQDAEQRAKLVLGALAEPAPLQNLEVELEGATWVGSDLRGVAAAGSSVAAFGYYEGGIPKKVRVIGKRDGKQVLLPVRKLSAAQAKRIAQVTLAATEPDSFPGQDSEESALAMQKAAADLGVVTQLSAVVAVDKNDGFARDRLAMARRWGARFYRRMAPAPERLLAPASWAHFENHSGAGAGDRGRTGQLDADMVASRVKAHVIPLARACYERQLRRDPNAGGELELHIEVARGEVQHASIAAMPLALQPIRECVLDAMYAMPIPRVRLGEDLEQVSVARYPLRFRMKDAGKASVAPGAGQTGSEKGPGELDPNDPLSGLPE